MRELIRPTLFIIARLGLFLAVVAWIVGQWWITTSQIAVLKVKMCDAGFLIDNKPASLDWSMSAKRSRETGPSQKAAIQLYFEDISQHDALTLHLRGGLRVKSSLNIPGIRITRHQSNPAIVLAIRHWLVITIFALFYGVLKWVYRKRGTEMTANE